MIEIIELQKVVDSNTVIAFDELKIQAGEIAALVGPVDSGKDILLSLLTGRAQPTRGTVRLDGIDPYIQRAAFSRVAGVLFGDENLYVRQSAISNLRFFSRLNRLPRQRAEEVLLQVGLRDHANVPVEKLSSSLKRRLSFGRAILHQPDVLLLVEPFARCDETSIALLSKIIQEKAVAGATVLILAEESLHLEALCTIIYRLEHGRIVDAFKPGEDARPDLPFMIPARPEGKVVLVNPADILYAAAQDDRTYLQTTGDRLPTQFTLAELEKRLARSGFFRAHRGYLVNLQHVKEVIPYTRDSYSLRLKDDNRTEIPLSKSAAQELRDLLGY
jgi:ABC-2 type transport system ATP-binding protein